MCCSSGVGFGAGCWDLVVLGAFCRLPFLVIFAACGCGGLSVVVCGCARLWGVCWCVVCGLLLL